MSASPREFRVRTVRRSGFPDIAGGFVRLPPRCCALALTGCGFASTVRFMTDDRASGLALLFSSVGLLVVIAFHPTSGNFSVARNIAVHSLALATIPVMFLGALGIYRRLAAANRLSLSGLVLYAV